MFYNEIWRDLLSCWCSNFLGLWLLSLWLLSLWNIVISLAHIIFRDVRELWTVTGLLLLFNKLVLLLLRSVWFFFLWRRLDLISNNLNILLWQTYQRLIPLFLTLNFVKRSLRHWTLHQIDLAKFDLLCAPVEKNLVIVAILSELILMSKTFKKAWILSSTLGSIIFCFDKLKLIISELRIHLLEGLI